MQGALVRSTGIVFWHYAGTTGLTLKAVVLNGPAGAFNFTTGAFITNKATATWSELQRDLTEIVDTGPNPMGIYSSTTSFPAALVPGDYTIVIQDGTTAVDDRLAIQPMHWDGTYWTPIAHVPFTDVDQEAVPPTRTWTLRETSSGLVGELQKATIDGTAPTYAIDFRNVLATNQRIVTFNSITITDGEAGGVTFGTLGRDRSQAKVKITAVTPDTYTLRVNVTDSDGNVHIGDVVLKVNE